VRTKTSMLSAPAFHISALSLSFLSAWDRYRESRGPEESVNQESDSGVSSNIPVMPLSNFSRELAWGAAAEQLPCQVLIAKGNCGTLPWIPEFRKGSGVGWLVEVDMLP
jgi:hypothetical protein